MGRPVATIVGIVAAVGIAIAAPYLGGAIATAIFGSTASALAIAVTTAAVSLALSIGVALAFRALGVGAPKAASQVSPPALERQAFYPVETACILNHVPDLVPLERSMPSVPGSFLRRCWRGQALRLSIIEMKGDCMQPDVTDRYAVVDVYAPIREGDLFSFRTKDHSQAFGHYGRIGGVVKRFIGVNRELGYVECICANPPRTVHTGLTNLLWAHRIIATVPTLREAKQLLQTIRRGANG